MIAQGVKEEANVTVPKTPVTNLSARESALRAQWISYPPSEGWTWYSANATETRIRNDLNAGGYPDMPRASYINGSSVVRRETGRELLVRMGLAEGTYPLSGESIQWPDGWVTERERLFIADWVATASATPDPYANLCASSESTIRTLLDTRGFSDLPFLKSDGTTETCRQFIQRMQICWFSGGSAPAGFMRDRS